jgi:hypothetical protein
MLAIYAFYVGVPALLEVVRKVNFRDILSQVFASGR